jgi:hypothetical protein
VGKIGFFDCSGEMEILMIQNLTRGGGGLMRNKG